MYKRNLHRIVAVVFAWVVVGTPSAFGILSPITNLYEYFDTNIVGAAPAGWSTGGGGFAVVTNGIYGSAPNSLLLANTNVVLGAAYALKSLSPSVSTNYGEAVSVYYRMNLAQVNASVNVLLTDSGTSLFLRNTFNNAGNLTTTSNGTDIVLAPYTSNVWYDVNMKFVPVTDTYDIQVWTNGGLVVSRTGLPFAADRTFFYLYLQNFGKAGGQANAFVDNIFVFVPEPSSLMLVAAGLFGLAVLKRRV